MNATPLEKTARLATNNERLTADSRDSMQDLSNVNLAVCPTYKLQRPQITNFVLYLQQDREVFTEGM